jgi:hypothetical protein
VSLNECVLLESVLSNLCKALTQREQRSLWQALKSGNFTSTHVFFNERLTGCYVEQQSQSNALWFTTQVPSDLM